MKSLIFRRALSVVVLAETLLITIGAFVMWRFGHSMARFDGREVGAHVEMTTWVGGAAGGGALLVCSLILWRRGAVGAAGRLPLRVAIVVGLGLQVLLLVAALT